MLLFTGISLLISPRLSVTHVVYAKTLINCFVTHFNELYGNKLVYNVHCLTHLSQEVAIHGHLDKISAFPYENYLNKVKKMVRKASCPLQQVLRRVSEQTGQGSETAVNQLKRIHVVGPLIDSNVLTVRGQYQSRDNLFLLVQT